jgi:hypothetical protein
VEEAARRPVRLNGLMESPPQEFFSFESAASRAAERAALLRALAARWVNIRFLSTVPLSAGALRINISLDSAKEEEAREAFALPELGESLDGFYHHREARVLSLHPLRAQPRIADAVLHLLRTRKTTVLCAGTASSVFSLVIPEQGREATVAALKEEFMIF